jgi:hypothetical protein
MRSFSVTTSEGVHLTVADESLSAVVARLQNSSDERFKLDNIRKIELIEEFE